MDKNFTTKGYGRIYVMERSHIDSVKHIIKEMDQFEYDYLPDDFITVFSEYPKLIFTHKFDDLDLDQLALKCFEYGVPVLCIDNRHSEFIGEV